jgi:hypothetical protein
VSLQTKLKAGEARERLKQVKARTLELQKQLTNELQAARSHTDKHLSAEGLAAKRQELEKTARARLERDLQALRAQVDQDARTVREFAEELRQQRLWDRARQLLDSGRTLPQVIADTDDVETLLAIRDEAPTWLRAQSKPIPGTLGQRNEPDVAGLLRSVDQRIAATSEGLPALATSWGLELSATEAALKPTFDYLTLQSQGNAHPGQGLHAAIASHMAQQEASRGLVDDDGGQDDGDASAASGGGEAA